MPEWISVWVAKIFGSEPVVKVMYVLLVWAALMFFSPDAIAATINAKTGIPFSSQVCTFALAFVIVDASHKLLKRIERHLISLERAKAKIAKAKNEKQEIFGRLDMLDSAEKGILSKFIESGANTIWLSLNNVNVTSLSQKRVIDCAFDRRRINGSLQMTYRVNDKYAPLLREFFRERKGDN